MSGENKALPSVSVRDPKVPDEAPYGPGHERTLRIKDEHLKNVLAGKEFLLFDGAMGTQLQERGLKAGELPELLCLEDPENVTAIHAGYVAAGSEAVTTNTFGANALKLAGRATVRQIFDAAVSCVRAAGARYVAADIGPTGALLEPMGTMKFDEAYRLFAEEAIAAEEAGADLFVIETMADLTEMKAALLAVREHTQLPVFATMTFGEDGRTFLGTTPEVAAVTLSSLGADAVGINCSLGPQDVAPLVLHMLPYLSCPCMVQANAGLPEVHDGKTTYGIDAEAFVSAMAPMVEAGVSIIGGCCGTAPDYIARERELLDKYGSPRPHALSPDFTVASSQALLSLAPGHVGIIGERINPTGKKRMKEALRSEDFDYILTLAIEQERAGAQVLDVNVGLPEIDETKLLRRAVTDISGVTSLPLQIDSATAAAVEAAVRSYPGKPLINSTNGREDMMEEMIPLAAHYGCALVCLTLDEEGIPATAEGRLAVAQKIYDRAQKAGMPAHDLVFDCLAMAASTDQKAPHEILKSIRLVKEAMPGVRTVLGVSNISFGLPFRPLINATFLAAAFAAGLDLAIINPGQQRMHDVVSAWRVLSGEDEAARAYVEENAGRTDAKGSASAPGSPAAASSVPSAAAAQTPEERALAGVLDGRKAAVKAATEELLATHDAMYAINQVLIPALDEVGVRFEKGTFFLPQLMASAEAAKAGFDAIKATQPKDAMPTKGKVALCTVKGDIHDIGKNIVKMLLENYGYEVLDVGRDVDPQAFCDVVVENHVKLAGLSALMTTTVPAMGETIELLRKQAPWCKVVVGGAVLNPEYAKMVGADYYAKDAAETAKIAAEVLG
ncbi:MAG: homocysteine S-methyltransferase family protein [Atopobiaceae bacterium]